MCSQDPNYCYKVLVKKSQSKCTGFQLFGSYCEDFLGDNKQEVMTITLNMTISLYTERGEQYTGHGFLLFTIFVQSSSWRRSCCGRGIGWSGAKSDDVMMRVMPSSAQAFRSSSPLLEALYHMRNCVRDMLSILAGLQLYLCLAKETRGCPSSLIAAETNMTAAGVFEER